MSPLKEFCKTEKIEIKVHIKNPQPKDLKLCKIVMPDFNMVQGDSAEFIYNFRIEYWGQIEERFRAIIELIKRGHVKEISIKELKQGEILVKKLLDHIREAEKYYGDKHGKRKTERKPNRA